MISNSNAEGKKHQTLKYRNTTTNNGMRNVKVRIKWSIGWETLKMTENPHLRIGVIIFEWVLKENENWK